MEKFGIGRAFTRANGLISSTIGSVGLYVVLIQLVNGLLNFLLQGQLQGQIAAGQADSNPLAPLAIFQSGWYWMLLGSSMILGAFLFAGATAGLIKADNGDEVSLGECFSAGLSKLLPVAGLLILWLLGIYAGFILLLVPGCILMAMWSVTVPALIADNTGVFGAFGRSRALTKGSRWKIFLLLLIVVVLLYVILVALMALFAIQGGAGMFAMDTSLPMQIVMGVFGAGFALVINALLVAIYSELVDLKGEHTSGVFD